MVSLLITVRVDRKMIAMSRCKLRNVFPSFIDSRLFYFLPLKSNTCLYSASFKWVLMPLKPQGMWLPNAICLWNAVNQSLAAIILCTANEVRLRAWFQSDSIHLNCAMTPFPSTLCKRILVLVSGRAISLELLYWSSEPGNCSCVFQSKAWLQGHLRILSILIQPPW